MLNTIMYIYHCTSKG